MRTQEPLDQRRQRGLFDRLTGGNLRTTANQERELYEADERRRLADERAARNAALGQEVFDIAGGMRGERPEDLNLQQGQEALRNIRQLGVAGAQLGDRIDVPTVALPPPTEQQMDDLLTELQTATAPRPVGPARDIMPQEGDVRATKPGAVRVLDATGTEIAPDANAIAGSQPGVRAAPLQGYTSVANEEANSTPAPTTTVNTAMDKFNQMNQETDEEEEEEVDMSGNPNSDEAMLTALRNKLGAKV